MRIKNIKLQNFKKFSNLTINNLPDTVKLVVLLGPNGCGKSSLIESMEVARKIYGLHQIPWNDSNFNYYIKQDRIINKVHKQKGAKPQTIEEFQIETQLSKLSFHGNYYIRNLANPLDVTLQTLRHAPQIILDLVKAIPSPKKLLNKLGKCPKVMQIYYSRSGNYLYSHRFTEGKP